MLGIDKSFLSNYLNRKENVDKNNGSQEVYKKNILVIGAASALGVHIWNSLKSIESHYNIHTMDYHMVDTNLRKAYHDQSVSLLLLLLFWSLLI